MPHCVNIIFFFDIILFYCSIKIHHDIWQCSIVPLQWCVFMSWKSILAMATHCAITKLHCAYWNAILRHYYSALFCHHNTKSWHHKLCCGITILRCVIISLHCCITVFHCAITMLSFDITYRIEYWKTHCAIIMLHCNINTPLCHQNSAFWHHKITLYYWDVEFDYAAIRRSSLSSVLMMGSLSVIILRMSVNNTPRLQKTTKHIHFPSWIYTGIRGISRFGGIVIHWVPTQLLRSTKANSTITHY